MNIREAFDTFAQESAKEQPAGAIRLTYEQVTSKFRVLLDVE